MILGILDTNNGPGRFVSLLLCVYVCVHIIYVVAGGRWIEIQGS